MASVSHRPDLSRPDFVKTFGEVEEGEKEFPCAYRCSCGRKMVLHEIIPANAKRPERIRKCFACMDLMTLSD